MTTYNIIEPKIRRLVLDVNSAVEAELTTYINRAMDELDDMRPGFKHLEGLHTELIALTTKWAHKPLDWNGFREPAYWDTDADGAITELTEVYDATTIRKDYPDSETGSPKYYLDHGDNPTASGTLDIELFPVADNNGDHSLGGGNFAYQVNFPYWKAVNAAGLSAGGENWWTHKAADYIIWRASAMCFELNRDPMAAYWHGRADDERKRLVRKDRRDRFSRGSYMEPTERLGGR